MQYKKHYDSWLNYAMLDDKLKQELLLLNEEEIKDRFSIPLEFGTGGLRGKMGVGISRVNIYTIQQAAYGFGLYLKRHYKQGKVAISYDNRKDSYVFAKTSALVLSGLGIESLVFKSLRPTPMLSYAVRHFDCIGGIMITASHNPKEDNGFKAYNQSGAQLNLEEANQVIDYILGIHDIFSIPMGKENLISYLDDSFDTIYYHAIKDVNINPIKYPKKIVYSPLHGTGGQIIPKLLKQLGYDVYEVSEEMTPDDNFTYTKSSNPEQSSAYINSLKKAQEIDADIILVTDPDADRLGVAVKHHGHYELLNGNQTAAIELHYIVSEKQKKHTLHQDGLVYTTIVTSNLIKDIAQSFHLDVITTLTGFKFIGEQAEIQTRPYIFGCEESYGSLVIDSVRDKDAVQACLLLAEIASQFEHETLVDYLNHLYETYGYYMEAQENYFFEGISGKEKMVEILSNLRKNPLEIQGFTLESVTDYLASEHYESGKKTEVLLPKSNVLVYRYSGHYIIFRPSGTEPKLKIYISVNTKAKNTSLHQLELIQKRLKEYFGGLM